MKIKASWYLWELGIDEECKIKPCSEKELHPVMLTIKLNIIGGKEKSNSNAWG